MNNKVRSGLTKNDYCVIKYKENESTPKDECKAENDII